MEAYELVNIKDKRRERTENNVLHFPFKKSRIQILKSFMVILFIVLIDEEYS